MTRIIVWGRRNSVNVQKVMWAIGEMDLKYIRHDVSGSFGVNDNYLKLNPSGTVPTIEDGKLTLWESNTCIRYLARQYGSGTLYPDNPNGSNTCGPMDGIPDKQSHTGVFSSLL